MKQSAPIEIEGISDQLASALLQENLVIFKDPRYPVTSGEHEVMMRLFLNPDPQVSDHYIVLYVQIPYSYRLPIDLEPEITNCLSHFLKKTILLEFENAGTEKQKKELLFRISLGGELK
jgi:hypothetical protein